MRRIAPMSRSSLVTVESRPSCPYHANGFGRYRKGADQRVRRADRPPLFDTTIGSPFKAEKLKPGSLS
jgi:hypothetical protein